MPPTNLHFSLDAFDRLLWHAPESQTPIPVVPVRAFPIAAPEESIALVDEHGHERVWIDRMDDLGCDMAQLLRQALTSRELTPTILRIKDVSRFATPSVWHIDTDHGATELTLNTEDDIRHLPSGGFLVADKFGLQFKIPNRSFLDRHSQRLLARFL
ncbi:MAG: cyanophycin metabolism-associated DUF1854 family protein [Halothiobacillus sp.]